MGDGSITCAEAGRRGGRAVVRRYGPAHMARIAALAPRLDRAGYAALGRLGAAARLAAQARDEAARRRYRADR